MKRAYLFDIDGTLLKIKRQTNRIIIQQVLKKFGFGDDLLTGTDFAGKTDRDIFSSLLNAPADELFEEVKQRYLRDLDHKITSKDIHVYKGVSETISYLKHKKALTGLLSGNFAEAARIKLSRIGLNEHFSFGVFGDDDHDRNDLPPKALQSLQNLTDTFFHPSDLIIIGDTPRDIRCAQSFGAISVAVATGSGSFEELHSCNPDVVLGSLGDFPEWDKQFHNVNTGRDQI